MRLPVRNVTIGAGIVWGAVLLATTAFRASAEEELRTWTDDKGEYSVKVRFVKVEDDHVVLLDEQGNEVEILLRKLGQADRDYVSGLVRKARKERSKKNRDKKKDVNPPEKKRLDPEDPEFFEREIAKQQREFDQDSKDIERQEAKKAALKEKRLTAVDGDWSVDVAELPDFDPNGIIDKIVLPAPAGSFEEVAGVALNAAAKVAVVGYADREPDSRSSWFVHCDLQTGRMIASDPLEGERVPIAVTPDGMRILALSRNGIFATGVVELWTLKDGRLSRDSEWKPHEAEQEGGRNIQWAAFAGDRRLITMGSAGQVIIWSYPALKPLAGYRLHGGLPAISPDGRLFAFFTGAAVGILDLEKRKVVAQKAAPKMNFAQLAFSPSGRRLACVGHDGILVWDVVTGALEVQMPRPGIGQPVLFCDEDYLLCGDQLVDLNRQLALWTYHGKDEICSDRGLTCITAFPIGEQTGALLTMRLPHDEPRTLFDRANADPELIVLQPGTVVSINVDGIANQTNRDWAARTLEQRLSEIGCTAGAGGTIELVASVEGPKQGKVKVTTSRSGRATEVDAVAWLVELRFVYQGGTAWERKSNNFPSTLKIGPNESVEQAVARYSSPNFDFIAKVSLPKILLRPVNGRPAATHGGGSSRFTTAGIE